MSSLVDQFYLYNSALNASRGAGEWSSYLDDAGGNGGAPTSIMTDADKERFSRDLDQLEEAVIDDEGHDWALQGSSHHVSAHSGAANGGDWSAFDRNEQWRSRKNAHLEQLRRDLEHAEASNCTFRPRIDDRSRRIAPRGEDVGQRLHELHVKTIRERRARVDEQQRREAAQLTFQPRLVRSEWTESVQPRYLDPHDDGGHHGSAHQQHFVDETCTFQPVINHNRSSDEAIARYLSLPVHERLIARQISKKARGQHDSGSSSRRKISQTEIQAFIERTQKAEEERRQKIARMQRQEREEQLHTPRRAFPVNAIAGAVGVKVEGSVFTRNAALQAKIDQRRNGAPPPEPECTFTPRINRVEMHQKRAPDAVLRTNKLHMQELLREKEEREREAEKELTFHPKLSPSARRAKGKIAGALKSADAFDVFVKTQRGIREADVRQWRDDEEHRIKSECTFTPTTGEVPAAVRAIANSLHATSQQSSAARDSRPTTPRFRF